MIHRRLVWAFSGMLLLSTGCERRTDRFLAAPGAAGQSAYDKASPSPEPAVVSPQRFIAEHHDLDIVTPESELQKAWESAAAYCNSSHCEILSSKLTTRTDDSTPSGTISLRVVPGELTQLLDHVMKLGSVAQHTTERDDKTTDVVDTEAKIKNLTVFRDNLRAMLTRPSATVEDLINIQHQLADTQSELDSEVAQRKILANETEKVSVGIEFRVDEPRSNSGAFARIRNALRESGSVLAESTASLITMVVAFVPWLMALAVVIWILAKLWRRARHHRKVSPPSRVTGA